jgi:hypothetical protein
MKTSELTGAALDWAVAKCAGILERTILEQVNGVWAVAIPDLECGFEPSTCWAQGGPIIERESIGFTQGNEVCDEWVASYSWVKPRMDIDDSVEGIGPTPLTAAMRCYVASKLGDEVEIPEELK